MRMPQKKAVRGSQKWLQVLVNQKADVLSKSIVTQCPELAGSHIDWLSPLEKDEYAEYRDDSFLVCMGLEKHTAALRDFWPQSGPRWDGLGRTKDSTAYFLIEAKAHVTEILSNCDAKSSASLEKINSSLGKTRKWLKAKPRLEWTTGFYQYANRLAHLFFLREIAEVRAYLINICFLHDTTLDLKPARFFARGAEKT